MWHNNDDASVWRIETNLIQYQFKCVFKFRSDWKRVISPGPGETRRGEESIGKGGRHARTSRGG